MKALIDACLTHVETIFQADFMLMTVAFFLSLFAGVSHWLTHNQNRDFKAQPFQLTKFVGQIGISLFCGMVTFMLAIYFYKDSILVLIPVTIVSYIGSIIIYRAEEALINRFDKESEKFETDT